MAQVEFNRFYPNANGDRGEHVKIVADSVEELALTYLEFEEWRTQRPVSVDYAVDDDVPFDDEPPHPAQQPRRSQRDGVRCGVCGGETWNNLRKKANGEFSARSPDFSCKDKSCGAAMWLTDEGEHGQWKQK